MGLKQKLMSISLAVSTLAGVAASASETPEPEKKIDQITQTVESTRPVAEAMPLTQERKDILLKELDKYRAKTLESYEKLKESAVDRRLERLDETRKRDQKRQNFYAKRILRSLSRADAEELVRSGAKYANTYEKQMMTSLEKRLNLLDMGYDEAVRQYQEMEKQIQAGQYPEKFRMLFMSEMVSQVQKKALKEKQSGSEQTSADQEKALLKQKILEKHSR